MPPLTPAAASIGADAPSPTLGARALVVSSRGDARLAVARSWLAELRRDATALVVAAHGPAADALARDDAGGAGTRFGVQRWTLDRLATRLAAAELARRGAVPATALTLAAVVTRATHRLLAQGALGRLAGVAGRPGFPHAVVRTYDELRRAGVAPAALRVDRDAAELATLLEHVEAELGDLGLADRAARVRWAREAVESGAAPFAGAPLLLLDLDLEGAADAEFLAALIAKSPRVLATTAAADPQLARLADLLGVAPRDVDPPTRGSLASLQRHVFGPGGPAEADDDGEVLLTSWPGEARECVEIARRLQSLAAAGTPFDRMAVLLRAPALYRARLEEALRRAAIPAYFAHGTTRPDPAGRAFLALLGCAREGLSARRFAEYLSLAQVPDPAAPEAPWVPPAHDLLPPVVADDEAAPPAAGEPVPDPDAPVIEGSLRAPWRWERLIVDAAVIGGRDRWRRRLDGLTAELRTRRSEVEGDEARARGLDRAAADLEHLRTFSLPLIDRLAALPNEATWGAWLDYLQELACAALRQPAGVLELLAELAPLAPVGPVDLTGVLHVLAPRLRELAVGPDRRPGGAVFVAPVEYARGMAFDVVFVPGLAEKVFPARIADDPLLADEPRGPLGLPTRDVRVQAEKLALQLAVGAARRQVALSWPRIDLEQARARVPSFYVQEALRAAEGHLPGFDELRRRAEVGAHARLGWPAPERAADAIDDAEYDLATLARVGDRDAETSAGAAHYLLAANTHLARALRARGRRWLRRWTSADGLVDPDAETLAVLERHRLGRRSFSPTALENFAACPYRFLLQAIHRLEPREDAEPLETIDPLTRGALFHDVQFEVLTALRDGGALPLDPARVEHAYALLEDAVQRIAAEYEERLAPAIPRVWADGVTAIRADLREWLRRSAETPGGWVPHRFELSFGLADRRRAHADAASVPDPVRVLDGVLLRGSIDLVERRADGVLRVTDHKTGKARAVEGAVIGGGKTLQPVLYALTAEAVLGAAVESGRLYYCTADGDFTERVIPLDETSRAAARAATGTVARAIEAGFLPAAPAEDACRWCDFFDVCGPNEAHRVARKPQDRLEDLVQLRNRP